MELKVRKYSDPLKYMWDLMLLTNYGFLLIRAGQYWFAFGAILTEEAYHRFGPVVHALRMAFS